jgi:hypothetical protein
LMVTVGQCLRGLEPSVANTMPFCPSVLAMHVCRRTASRRSLIPDP